MSDSMKQAWSELGESFTSLGAVVRDRYRAAKASEAVTEEAAGEEAESLRRAFDQVAAAVRELGDRVADVARDDDVKAQARATASSFDVALTSTVDLITEQISGLFGSKQPPPDTPDTDQP